MLRDEEEDLKNDHDHYFSTSDDFYLDIIDMPALHIIQVHSFCYKFV